MDDNIIKHFFQLALKGGGEATLAVKSQWTNKANLLAHQEYFIQLENEYAANSEQLFHSTVTPTHRGGSNKGIKLLEKHRVNIATLLDHVNNVIDGKFFLCRTISPTSKMTGIMLIVEDPEGEKALRLALYNYSELTGDNLNLLFPVGLIMAVKSPFLKVGMDGGLLLRCDNPANLIIISESNFTTMFPNLGWKGTIEAKYLLKTKKSANEEKVVQAKNSGNKAFIEKKYFDAIRFYTDGLELCKDVEVKIELLSNRAAAYISLGCYRVALIDATAVLQRDPGHIKGIYRNVRALWGLGRYEEGLTFLKRKFKKIPALKKETVLSDLQNLGEQFVIQHETGIYDMANIIKTSDHDNKNPDLAEFMGALEIAEIPGKGRGLVAKKDFKAGDLLMCCKAFVNYKPDQEPNGDIHLSVDTLAKKISDHDFVIAGKVAQKISLDAELGTEFYELFAGRDFDTTQEEDDDNRIHRIVAINSFSPRNTDSTIKISGVWITPSYFNHSCIDANALWTVYGDFMFVRAVVPIREGEEVTISYTNTERDFSARKANFKDLDFTCSCLLCEIQEGEEASTRERRKQVMKSIKFAALGDLCPKNVRKILKNISELESLQKIYPKLHVFFNDEIFTYLGSKLAEAGMFRDFLFIMEKVI